MGALTDLVNRRRAEAEGKGAANSAKTANNRQGEVEVSRFSQDLQGVDAERARLLQVAECDGLPQAAIHRLPDGELVGCEALTDEGLRAYLLALEASELMNMGIAPPMYRTPARCEKCGPVYLAENQPATVKGCPWCFRRAAGKAIPRPPVTCEGCAHRIPGRVCPEGGMGRCKLDAARFFWPSQKHPCADHTEAPP